MKDEPVRPIVELPEPMRTELIGNLARALAAATRARFPEKYGRRMEVDADESSAAPAADERRLG